MEGDQVVLRSAQKRLVTAGLNALERGEDTVVADMHPGSGKTLGTQALANELFRRGEIDAVVVLTPRINLCQQYETDWRDIRSLFANPSMGPIVHRDNEVPLIRLNQFGYATTYQSFVSQPEIHFDLFNENLRRIALIGDEWQTARADPNNGEIGTKCAYWLQRAERLFRFKTVVSGTAYGSDGIPLLYAKYSEPDGNGLRYLTPDVRSTYTEGVAEEYLRKFEYELFDGQAYYEYLDGRIVDLTLSKMNNGIHKVSSHQDYWHPLVDRTVEAVREVQNIDRRLCGLIGANNQAHAKQIIRYLESRHRVKVLLAVSDEKLALDNLRKFKLGGYDILVTVAMAHMGYDYKPITVVTCLNSYRQTGWLDQFFARGMRVMSDIPFDMQTVRCIVPNDIKMKEYVENKRNESETGLREREHNKKKTRDEGPQIEWIGHTLSAQVTGTDVMGMDEEMDLDSHAYEVIVEIKKKYDLGPANLTGIGKLLRDVGAMPEIAVASVAVVTPPKSMKTEREKEKEVRADIRKISQDIDRRLGAPDTVYWGYTNTQMKFYFGRSRTTLSHEELVMQLKWLVEEFYPLVAGRFIK